MSQPSSQHSTLDLEVLAGLRELETGGETGFVAELLGMFLGMAPERLRAIGAAVAAKDGKALKSEAHSLKSSCGNIGAKKMSALCFELEHHEKLASFTEAETKLAELQAEYAKVEAEIRTLPEMKGQAA